MAAAPTNQVSLCVFELLLAESVEQTGVIYQPNQLEAVAAYFEKRAANFK